MRRGLIMIGSITGRILGLICEHPGFALAARMENACTFFSRKKKYQKKLVAKKTRLFIRSLVLHRTWLHPYACFMSISCQCFISVHLVFCLK